MKRHCVLLALVLLLAGTCFAQYSYTTFEYPGAGATRFIGFNDHFDVVGHYVVPGTTIRHAMKFSKGVFTPLDPDGVLGLNPSAANQINNRGDITGWYTDANGRHGMLLRDGVVQTIDYPGSNNSQLNGISDTGVMFGYFRTGGRTHGYILRDGQFTQIDYPGSRDTMPYYMNARGDLAGNWDTDYNTVGHGFVLTREGDWISFDVPLAPADSTMAIGINDTGQILGVYRDANGVIHPFVAQFRNSTVDDYTYFEIPGTGGFPETGNASGAFVGYYTGADNVVRGFIATPLPRPKE